MLRPFFNPFDKQFIKERDAFRSQDHRQMQSRLDYLRNVRGIGVFTARPGMRKTYDLLGLEGSGSKTQMFKEIQERVYYLYKEKKQPLILAIDEAQYLNYSILRDLKMLMNYSYDSLNCFSLVLVGEPYLNHILEK